MSTDEGFGNDEPGFRFAIAHGYAERNPAAEIRLRDAVGVAQISQRFGLVLPKTVPEFVNAIRSNVAIKMAVRHKSIR